MGYVGYVGAWVKIKIAWVKIKIAWVKMKFAWVKEDFKFKNPLSKELMNVLKIYFDQLTKIEKSSLSYKILKTIGEYFRQDSNLENKKCSFCNSICL